MAVAMANASNSNQSNCGHESVGGRCGLESRSMSKWTRNVSSASSTTMIVMMAVAIICVIPAATEAKSLYGGGGGEETVAGSAAGAHESGALDHERQQQLAGNEIADLIDYGGARDRDEYDGGVAYALPVENPLLNYLYSRQMLQRLRPAAAVAAGPPSAYLDQSYPASPYAAAASYYLSPAQQQQQMDGIRKRTSTYWKQCAFNAVSCFGRK